MTKGNAPDTEQMNQRVSKLIEEAILAEGVSEVFTVEKDTPRLEQDIFSDEYIERINRIPLINTKIKLLQRLLRRAIEDYRKVNRIKGVDFTERMNAIVDMYNARRKDKAFANEVLDEVAEQLTKLLEDLGKDKMSFEALHISFEEKAFFDILEAVAKKYNFYDEYIEKYGEESLLNLAKDIKAIVDDKAKYAAWSARDDIKAEFNLKDKRNYVYNYYFIGFQYSKGGHGLVRILDKTLREALQKNDFEMIDRMNSLNRGVISWGFNCGVVSDDEIRVAKLKLDKSVSKQEVLVQSAIHDGIIDINELLAVDDIDLIEKTLKEYPVSKFEQIAGIHEKLRQALASENWRYIFEYAVDKKAEPLLQYVIKGEEDRIRHWIDEKDKIPLGANTTQDLFLRFESKNPNGKYLNLRTRTKFSGTIAHSPRTAYQNQDSSIIYTMTDLVEYISLCKKQVVDDFKANHNAGEVIEELNEEFFRNELAKGNDELVAIKLCVRLEAVLKSKYHYEGDFSEMLERFCKEQGKHLFDDGWGYMVPRMRNFVPYLQKLRKYRNSIVHSEKKVDKMTKEEFEFCIKYICGLK